MAELAQLRPQLEASGTQLAFVHMGSKEQGQRFFSKYSLETVPRFSDPPAILYRAFGLRRTELKQFLSIKLWKRGMETVGAGHHTSQVVGDGLRMPGVFLIHRGKIVQAYRHEHMADRPPYQMMCQTNCAIPNGG